MDVPYFSIITPTLNAERFLSECLASVRCQEGVSFEHLVVDGGSTDHTEEIARAAGVGWLSHRGNQSSAINRGLREARGEVAAWLNADDQYAPGALAMVQARFEEEPSLEVVYGDCDVVGPDGDRLWRERPGAYDFTRLRRRGNYLAQPAVFPRRRVLEELGGLDTGLEYSMDFDLWLRLRGRRVAYLPRTLARFRWHQRSKSARGQLAAWAEVIEVVRRHGGNWTPELRWAYLRCRVTMARTAVVAQLRAGS